MTNDRGVHGDVESYVLGALDPSDRAVFEQHLDACAACQREVISYLPVLNALREMPLPPAPPLPRATSRNVVPFRRTFLAAAAAAIFAVGGIGGSAVQRTMSSDMMTVAEMGVTSVESVALRGEGIEGRALVGQGRRRTAFVVAGLPQPASDHDYQVWIDNGSTYSPGVLHRSMHGFEVLVVPGDLLRDAQSIRITLEATGGSRHMTGRPIITGATHDV
jgi:anti-sigma-K factor RskA